MDMIEITDKTPFDMLEKIIHIEKEVYGSHGAIDIWTLRPIIRCGKVYVLTEKGNIVSIAEFMPSMVKNTIYLYGLCTANDHKNKGYAKMLLNRSEKELIKGAFKKIFLTVSPNNDPARYLYSQSGYQEISFSKNEYGENEDRIIMEKILTK